MNDDAESRAYERYREARARLESLWGERFTNPEEFSAALNALNDAGMALNRIWEESRKSA